MRTLLFTLFPLFLSAQIHLTAGVSEIGNKLEGNSIATNFGYTNIKNTFGYRVGVMTVNTDVQKNYNWNGFAGIKLIDQGDWRFEVGAGATFNDKKNSVDPSVFVRTAFQINKALSIIIDYQNVFADDLQTHLLGGIALKIKRNNYKPRFF